MIVDFTSCKKNKYKFFGGPNSQKIGITYNEKSYVLKFPLNSQKAILEHIGCNIFSLLGIPAQKTTLGTFASKGKVKTVVACSDLEEDGYLIKDFASIKNSIPDSSKGSYKTELSDILKTIEKQTLVSPTELKQFFWDMFIIDSFLGVTTRTNENWGFLINSEKKDAVIAPIFSCGACLYYQSDIEFKREFMQNSNPLKNLSNAKYKSAIKQNGKNIVYFDFLKSGQNTDCTKSLVDITNRIDLIAINKVIDNISLISSQEKEFYIFVLMERKLHILDKAIQELGL